MSFRTAYSSLRSGQRTSRLNGGLHRDPTPEQWKKTMDDYYIQQRTRVSGTRGKK